MRHRCKKSCKNKKEVERVKKQSFHANRVLNLRSFFAETGG